MIPKGNNRHLSSIKDMRILFFPSMTVAAYCCTSAAPESDSMEVIVNFIRKNELILKKPDFRHFGFCYNAADKNGIETYERWLTIPDKMEVEEPFQKKLFSGGLYAAHMIPIGYYDEWAKMYEWISSNEQYVSDFDKQKCDGGILEEHLNFQNAYQLEPTEIFKTAQLDLLLRITPKNNKE